MNAAYAGYLACLRCGTRIEETEAFSRCPACLGQGIGVHGVPVYDPERVTAWAGPADEPGLFRFRELLPLRPETRVVSRAEGGTPLVPCPRLGRELGLTRLAVKDETRNPTWSYKDRLAAVAVTKAVEVGAGAIVVSSTGNHGAAAAAYAAVAGLPCVALTVSSVPLTMKVLMQSYGARVAAFQTGPERWTVMAEAVATRGWTPLSGFVDPPAGSNPFGVDGYKTLAYELVADLGHAPDVVVVPTAYGDGLLGVQRGFADLVAMGRIPALPRLVAAEPLGPYAHALVTGAETPGRVASRPSVAFSTATPVGTFQGLHALRASGGQAVAVPEDDVVLEAQLLAARTEGLYLEAASAVAVVAAQRLREAGEVGRDDTVVLLGTSTGLKDVGATAARLPEVPVVEATLNALEDALGRLPA